MTAAVPTPEEVGGRLLPLDRRNAAQQIADRVVTAIALGQIALGFFNVVMLAPVWLQLAHLLVADALWIGFVLLGAYTLTDRAVATRRAHAA